MNFRVTKIFDLFFLQLFLCGFGMFSKDFIFFLQTYFSPLTAHVLCVDTGRSSETAKAHRG
eukprot:TRINITY_DN8088_c0_g1_i1.p2 TRINITY_DN8088_c0_g1~~TRINITY_DN8088_c0_g1_i1.p2  ORF type:complete len:61 (+),score=12.97 TRINITY_DN8088_c0_g1_i1:237-419(+)